jgi:HPt (histidine-containing phosphotransfer) domain-containing protein
MTIDERCRRLEHLLAQLRQAMDERYLKWLLAELAGTADIDQRFDRLEQLVAELQQALDQHYRKKLSAAWPAGGKYL